MSKRITNGQAFNLAEKLNQPEILDIKDTEFALAVYKNLKSIVENYNILQEMIKPSEKWLKVTKDAKEEEDYTKLKEVKANKTLFATREKQISKYNEALAMPYTGHIVKVKVTNLKTRLSAKDLMDLESMLRV